MAIEIVDFPIKNGGSFHCYVSSPEGNYHVFCWFSVDEDAATSDTPETRVRRDVGPAKTKEVLVLEWSPGRGIVMILKVSYLMVINSDEWGLMGINGD